MFKKFHEFVPKSFFYLRKYNFDYLKKDLIAGITVGIVALPLAMAFAIASGVDPERGLYTAIIGGFIISLLGGSRVQIGGPAGAFVVVIYATVQRHGYDGLVLATCIASLMLLAMGYFRLGSLIKFVPYPLIVGFTTGIALVVFSSQIKEFFGLEMAFVPADFLEKWIAYFKAAASWDKTATAIGFSTLGLIFFLKRFVPSLPWGILSIVTVTAVCYGFDIPIETISSKFGEIPRSLPAPGLSLDWSKLFDVIPDSITIAFLAGIESLLSAVIADGMTGGRHKSNCELMAQGVANFGSVLFGGIPATATIARTAVNIKSGARTPVAGMVHALTVFAIIFFFAPLVGHVPLAALAAVLIVVAWNMSELRYFYHLFRGTKGDVLILLSSFLLTAFVDLTVGVAVGMTIAALHFMKTMGESGHEIIRQKSEDGIETFEMKGPFFFGVADRLKDVFQQLDAPPKIFILQMKNVPILDASGLHALKEFHKRCQKEGTQLILTNLQAEPAHLIHKFGLGELIK